MKLFSSAGTVYFGTEYADQKNRARIDIAYPCVTLHGTTTPETLWPALQSQDVVSGYLNRMLLFFVPERRVEKRYDVSVGQPPAAIVEWVKAAREISQGIKGLDPASPIEVPFSAMAQTILRGWDDWVENHMEVVRAQQLAPLWGRSWEHAAKIALGLACARHDAASLKAAASKGALEIDPTSAQWAVDLVRFVMQAQEHQVATRMGDSDFDRAAQEVLRVITAGEERGRTEAELARYSRMWRALEPRMQDAILDSLKRREAVALVQMRHFVGGRNPRMAWVSSDHVPVVEESS
jgi:hypothetical protein